MKVSKKGEKYRHETGIIHLHFPETHRSRSFVISSNGPRFNWGASRRKVAPLSVVNVVSGRVAPKTVLSSISALQLACNSEHTADVLEIRSLDIPPRLPGAEDNATKSAREHAQDLIPSINHSRKAAIRYGVLLLDFLALVKSNQRCPF